MLALRPRADVVEDRRIFGFDELVQTGRLLGPHPEPTALPLRRGEGLPLVGGLWISSITGGWPAGTPCRGPQSIRDVFSQHDRVDGRDLEPHLWLHQGEPRVRQLLRPQIRRA